MSERDKFIGAWVSNEEKGILEREALKHDIRISELIRRRAIRPALTNSELADMLMGFIGTKINEIKTLLKTQPLSRMTTTQKPITAKKKPIPKPIRAPSDSPRMVMRDVLNELGDKLEEIKEKYEIED